MGTKRNLPIFVHFWAQAPLPILDSKVRGHLFPHFGLRERTPKVSIMDFGQTSPVSYKGKINKDLAVIRIPLSGCVSTGRLAGTKYSIKSKQKNSPRITSVNKKGR